MSDGLQVEFTDVLYGVVIANAIYKLSFTAFVRNAMLLLALVFIIDDWVEYRLSRSEIDATRRNYVLALVLDVTILVVWYFLTVVPVTAFHWYLVVAAGFFSLQAVWDRLLLGRGMWEIATAGRVQVAAVYGLLALGSMRVPVSPRVLTVVAAVVFVLRMIPEWRHRFTGPLDAI